MVLTVVFVLLGACSNGAVEPTAQKGMPQPTVTSQPSPPLVIPSPTTPFIRCETRSLDMRLIKIGAATGNVGGIIEVRNKSGKNCDLYGYAGLQWLDGAGGSLPTRVTRSTSSFFINGQAPIEMVGLPAGTPPINPHTPVPGHAYIPLSWNDAMEPCVTPTKIRIIPPGASDSLVIDAALPGTTPGRLDVCSNGAVIVNPTRVATY